MPCLLINALSSTILCQGSASGNAVRQGPNFEEKLTAHLTSSSGLCVHLECLRLSPLEAGDSHGLCNAWNSADH
ncbi:hypothetical protein PLICRDRAFT_485945 [Plicaturopsis crispa FD-325 SS-3]|nr:hypothetical protein PLICRDRAFT_485945 [Plicaturopsis crispa FD-325 SS-3]